MSTVDVCQIVLNILKAAEINAYPDLPSKDSGKLTDAAGKLLGPITTVEEAGGPPNGNANRLNRQDLQVTSWGRSKKEAFARTALVRDLLVTSRNHVDAEYGVFIGCKPRQPMWLPDPDLPVGPRPGPRYVMIVSATAHA